MNNKRTENTLKNRYHNLIKKEKKNLKNVEFIPESSIEGIIASLKLSPEFSKDVPPTYEDINTEEL
jgi:hypothetical protein